MSKDNTLERPGTSKGRIGSKNCPCGHVLNSGGRDRGIKGDVGLPRDRLPAAVHRPDRMAASEPTPKRRWRVGASAVSGRRSGGGQNGGSSRVTIRPRPIPVAAGISCFTAERRRPMVAATMKKPSTASSAAVVRGRSMNLGAGPRRDRRPGSPPASSRHDRGAEQGGGAGARHWGGEHGIQADAAGSATQDS